MSATVSRPDSQPWLARLISRHPHQIIGEPDHPYLLRWFLIPQNRFCQIYLHRFIRSDDPTPHDHPWHFLSIVLQGNYFEVCPDTPVRCRRAGHFAFRRATHTHRVTLGRDSAGAEKPCTTLIITGPRIRSWGFWCGSDRFIPWQNFSAAGGCGDPS
jgi:hypothetical protein